MKNVKAIQEGNWPLIQKGLRSLVGLANYYHHFIRDFSKVARIIFNLLKKNDYSKSGMRLVTKPLWSSRASSLHKMWSSFWIFTSILRYT